MKKLKLSGLANAKKLERRELKNVFGGFMDSSFNIGSSTGSGQGYMCCNNGGCSACVTPARPACIAGAWAVPC